MHVLSIGVADVIRNDKANNLAGIKSSSCTLQQTGITMNKAPTNNVPQPPLVAPPVCRVPTIKLIRGDRTVCFFETMRTIEEVMGPTQIIKMEVPADWTTVRVFQSMDRIIKAIL